MVLGIMQGMFPHPVSLSNGKAISILMLQDESKWVKQWYKDCDARNVPISAKSATLPCLIWLEEEKKIKSKRYKNWWMNKSERLDV